MTPNPKPTVFLEELALLNNFTQKALVDLLIEKGIITEKEIADRAKQQALKHKLRHKKKRIEL